MNVTELDKKYKDRINTEIKNTLINTELNKGNKPVSYTHLTLPTKA